MKAARRPWPTAVVIIVGPVTTSPAAKTYGIGVCSVAASAFSVRFGFVSRPKASVSALMPAATITASQAMVLRCVSSYSGAKRPSSPKTQVQTFSSAPATRPSPTKWSMPQPSCSVTPSARASRTSKSWAGISSQHSRLTWSTEAAPSRRAERAASMATLPPPTTSTLLPVRPTSLPSFTSARKSRALITPSLSSPGTCSLTALCVPVATKTASNPSSFSLAGSAILTPVSISTPMAVTLATSSSTTALGSR